MDAISVPLPILLDGATGTELVRRGLPEDCCPETWVLEHPQVLLDLQRQYVAAGSQVLIAPTFGANRVGLGRYGLAEQVEEYNSRLVALTKQAAGGKALVAGNMATTGEAIFPFGEMTFETLVGIYTQQARALCQAGVDLFFLEAATTMAEARAAVLAIRETSEKPIFVAFTCDENGRAPSGTDVLAALIVMQGMGVSAFGISCRADASMEDFLTQLERLTPYATIPLIAEPGTDCVLPSQVLAGYVARMARAGARIFGGYHGVGPGHIAALAQAVQKTDFGAFVPPQHDPDVIPCASEREARFITPDVDVGECIDCTSALLENILDAEEEQPQGALKISIYEEEDVAIFAENQYAVRDALCISSDVPELLEAALRIYQGRAFWDGTEALEPEFLQAMAKKYGLVIL